uniref:Asl1-like glycosyl hydrolase catalytic domain-containing protein n=1 Tax=Zooxanthella nutricula TaxID=1333877 RepID=A0A6U6HMQ2_9DINO
MPAIPSSDLEDADFWEYTQEAAADRRARRLRGAAGAAATVAAAISTGIGLVIAVGLARHVSSGSNAPTAAQLARIEPQALLEEFAAQDDPHWGCGLLGWLPGITQDGVASDETQALISALKAGSTLGKVSYWNWNLAPESDEGKEQHLTADFVFMPEQWGAGVVEAKYVRQAGVANFSDSNGKTCPATMGDIFLGMNEPDIYGSCMGNMFGECKAPCDKAALAAGDCPEAHLHGAPGHANVRGQCNCWQDSHATGVGFWPLEGCASDQPLPQMWKDDACVASVMAKWRETAKIAVSKGYRYLSTPLVAENMDFARSFIESACATCHDASCGCPVYVGFHFYAYDCQPESTGGYATFQKRLDAVKAIMEKHPFVKGAIINEVGMLNCRGQASNPICIPDSGDYPATSQPDHSCPANAELPDGMASFMAKLFDMIIAAKTSDGRPVVKGFSWFNLDQAGGTYNLQLFDEQGKLNKAGHAYMEGCSRWAQSTRASFMKKQQ